MTERDTTIDILRGFAIFLMVQGNIAGSIFPHPYPLWGQLYVAVGSFVPALFILLAGMMVVYTTRAKGYTLKHFAVRGALLMASGAVIIDALIFGIIPFISVDVLYVIGAALPVAYLFQKLSAPVRWLSAAFFFGATPILQGLLGYNPLFVDAPLSGGIAALAALDFGVVANHWLVDGWFPLFPWFGFALLGVNIGLLRWKTAALSTFAQKKIIAWGAALVFAGMFLWSIYDGALFVRGGFGELIYPPTLAYVVTALGEILLLCALIDWKPNVSLYKPLAVFGASALFMYLAHFAVIEFFLEEGPTLSALFFIFFITLLVLFSAAYALEELRKKWKKRPLIVRYLLGI